MAKFGRISSNVGMRKYARWRTLLTGRGSMQIQIVPSGFLTITRPCSQSVGSVTGVITPAFAISFSSCCNGYCRDNGTLRMGTLAAFFHLLPHLLYVSTCLYTSLLVSVDGCWTCNMKQSGFAFRICYSLCRMQGNFGLTRRVTLRRICIFLLYLAVCHYVVGASLECNLHLLPCRHLQ